MAFLHDPLAPAGYEVEYFCSEDAAISNPRRRRLAFPYLVWRHAVQAARSGRAYDLVNVHEPSSALVSRYRSPCGNPRVIVTTHGLERRAWELSLQELRWGRSGPGWKTRLVHPLTTLWPSRLGLAGSDHVFCASGEDRDDLVRRSGMPPERITHIQPAADPLFAAAAGERRYAEADRLLFAATWRKNKGIEDLVPAFSTLVARHPRLTLTVLGGGVSDQEILSAFPDHARSRVRCLSAASERQTAEVFAAADIFILPSLFEGTPLTLMEAMMSGLPVVTTATCGMKDVIEDGSNGVLVPVRAPAAIASAVERLRADPECRERLGRSARRRAQERYTWDKVAVPVREAYDRLSGRRS